ncbi:NosD domain-containing protein [Candidatus Bathycorpusculum sp.]|jgi:parallel beta-helix repeat protein|uniref:NosD domain-containing protein n=1 Tax=Candidatus Bathycorpusculum sp. TaxID=2994959 RepID=UPI002819FA8E|nr:hypothetical protein [Candidatus Termitimicrobium sp.]MCL2686181.1 hypothetical protein [Candidatus Termitimicrobium sp.]
MKIIAVTITLTLLPLLLCSFGIVIKDADAQSPTITILPNGTVDPSSGIQRDGDTYTLTADLTRPIEIKRDNIILNGANHTLYGSSTGIAISLWASNITITNCRIIGWNAGIYGAYNNNAITANLFTDNFRAISLFASNYIIDKNIIQQNTQGIHIKTDAVISTGDNNLIINNQITYNSQAFEILNSDGTTITQNNITNNKMVLDLGNRAGRNTAGQHLIYLNNFVNNTQMLRVHSYAEPGMPISPPMSPSGNWDNGTAGNYWNDYTTKYPNATEKYHSGIGDTSYFIKFVFGTDIWDGTDHYWNGESVDHYPLIHAYDTPNEMGPKDPANSNPSPTPPISTTPKTPINTPIEYILAIILTLTILITITLTFRSKRKATHHNKHTDMTNLKAKP